MRILYLHQYFTTPRMHGGTRSYEFARRFVAAGHQVDMVTSWREPNGRREPFSTEEDGIRVHWLPVAYANEMGWRSRARAFAAFAVAASRKAAELGGDVIFATSTPLTIAIPALRAARRCGAPMVFEVRDLWPEAPRQMGVLTNPALLWAARQLELAAYRRASHIVALSPGMRSGVLASGVPAEKVSVIPNASDLELFHPGVDGSRVRDELRLGDRLALVYFGAMGPANGLPFVLDAAAELKRRQEERAVFVLHGSGMMRAQLEHRCRTDGLDNVVFSDPVPEKTWVAQLAAAADICLTIYKNLPVLYTCSPNKMFDALAAGRPVLTNMPGWLSDLVERNGCGIAVRPDDPIDFADRVQYSIAHRDQLPEMGRNARRLAETAFSRDLLASRLLAILEQAAERLPLLQDVRKTPVV